MGKLNPAALATLLFSAIGVSSCKLRLTSDSLLSPLNTPGGTLKPDFAGFDGATFGGAALLDRSEIVRLGAGDSNFELSSEWAPAMDKVVGYWRFNGDPGAISSGASIGAVVGPAGSALNNDGSGLAYSDGRVGQGIAFDGADDSIQFGNFAAANFGTADFSVAFWLKTTSSAMIAPVSKRATGGHANFWDVRFGNGRVSLEVDEDAVGTNAASVQSRSTVNDGVWHQVVFTRSGPDLNVYVDGSWEAATAGPGTANLSNANTFRIGALDIGDSSFAGSLDEVALWKTRLSADAVTAIYSRQSAQRAGTVLSRIYGDAAATRAWKTLAWSTSLPFLKGLSDADPESTRAYPQASADFASGLAGLWHFDETGTPSVYRDDSVASRPAQRNGDVRSGSSGILGGGLSFDGAIGSYVTLPIAAQSVPMTVALWFRTVNGGVLISNSNTAPDATPTVYDPLLYVRTDGHLGGYNYTAGSTSPVEGIVSGRAVNDGLWHHAVYINGANGQSQYLDGVLQGTAPAGTSPTTHLNLGTGFTSAWAGANGSWYYFKGAMDEVAFWNRELNASEIRQLYRRGSNRLRFQLRTCRLMDCSDDRAESAWKGPDGTNQSYFSEMDNRSGAGSDSSGKIRGESPSLPLSRFANPVSPSRYIQYRALLESDDTSNACDYGSCSPELRSISIAP